jgi:hypothetical protein
MKVIITATSAAHPALFAHVIRRAMAGTRPDIELSVRAIQAPVHRRFHTVEADDAGSFLLPLLRDFLPVLREIAETGDLRPLAT